MKYTELPPKKRHDLTNSLAETQWESLHDVINLSSNNPYSLVEEWSSFEVKAGQKVCPDTLIERKRRKLLFSM